MADTEEPEAPPEQETTSLSPDEERRLLDRMRDTAKAVAEEVVRTVLGDRESHAGPEGDEGEEGTATAAEPTSPRQIEAASEDAVREAVKRIQAEKEHEEHHNHLKEAERPPQQFSRLTKALWGDPQ